MIPMPNAMPVVTWVEALVEAHSAVPMNANVHMEVKHMVALLCPS